jgi:hypothetical protein
MSCTIGSDANATVRILEFLPQGHFLRTPVDPLPRYNVTTLVDQVFVHRALDFYSISITFA